MALRTLRNFKVVSNFIRHFSNQPNYIAVTVNDKTGVATLNLQRPPVNSLNLDLLSDISSALTELENNKSRGMILTSKNDGVFSAGLDITEMYEPDQDRLKRFWSALQETWIKLYGSSYPTVAVINGHSPAGGCLLALSCEYRVMCNNYTIGLNETLLGIVAPPWFVNSMINVIGQRQTELALTTGRLFKTDEALGVGLVDEVVGSKDEGIARAEVFFSRFAKISPIARATSKKYVRNATIDSMVNSRKADMKLFIESVNDPQVQKSLGLYMESLKKRRSS